MEILKSAVAGDLVGRLVSFVVSKYQEPEDTVRLRRALLRARAVVEEAEGRRIDNRSMLLQLNHLKREMCRGVYALDALRWRATDDPRPRAVARRPLRSALGTPVVESLEAAVSDMREFVVLLGGYPRLPRQPYSAYLFMERCMFGRQLEMEQIVGFLLQPAQGLDVLPVIGPREVGKRTLVEHVCLDERVREHFPKIHRLSSDDLDLQIHEPRQAMLDTAARSLIVVDLAGGDAERWRRFHSSLRRRAHSETKIILISRTKAHACLGTVPALRLRVPRREELWYFFRALAFGAADPEERPELLPVAMALFAVVHDPARFLAASIIAASLRADMNASSWRHMLNVFSGETHKCGIFHCRPVKGAPDILCSLYNRRKTAGIELPQVTILDLLVAGGAVLPGAGGETRLDVGWRSRVPPYVSYVATCVCVKSARQVVAGEERVDKRRRQR